MNSTIARIAGGLIVSCQALQDEPLYGSLIMKRMAIAAQEGGAIGIRANSPEDIREIKKNVSLPVIGLYKKEYKDSEIYITPTVKEIVEIIEAGADIVAFDATTRIRPGGESLEEFILEIKKLYPNQLLMGDIATLEEGINASRLGLDIISTTLSGYTNYTNHIKSFDMELLKQLVNKLELPIIAEGRVNTPELAAECIQQGSHAVVVGSAITRPQFITMEFNNEIQKLKRGDNSVKFNYKTT